MSTIPGYDRYMHQLLDDYLSEKEPCCTVCGAYVGGGRLAYEVDGELLCEDCMDDHISEYRLQHEVEL